MKAALRAAAYVVVGQAKLNARGGFTTGRYATTGWNTITYALKKKRRTYIAEVGSTRKHFAYWELGHSNKFTGNYEHVPWLKPAFNNTFEKQQAAAIKASKGYIRAITDGSGTIIINPSFDEIFDKPYGTPPT